MTGPENYLKAEKLAAQASSNGYGDERTRDLLLQAQVHATLALAAATALKSGANFQLPHGDDKAWANVAATIKP